MARRCGSIPLLIALGMGLQPIGVGAQGLSAEPSSLGPLPGAAESVDVSGGPGSLIGGRPGTFPRVPAEVTRPGEPFLPPSGAPDIGAVLEVPRPELPLYGSLALPDGAGPEGPPGGLTLDAAIARLLHANLDLRSKFLEIPQAQADILTAGLRANPILFYDTQFIPYGKGFSDANPGGPTQYDLNVTIPLDLNGKRRARVVYACQARRVLEAQYQDAVRLAIDELYRAFVDVLSARETVRYAQASVSDLDQLLEDMQEARRQGEATRAEVDRIRVQRDSARIGHREAVAALNEARRALIPLLNLAPAQAAALEVRGSIAQEVPPLPHPDALVGMALGARPDLAAYRLGLKASESGVRLARAERFEDVFLLYQPYQSQDFRPFGQGVATMWAMGVTVPLPVFNRNQGNIQRARVNVSQTRLELARQEQLVVTEVLQAAQRLAEARASVEEIARNLLPVARHAAEDALRRSRQGETDFDEYLNAQRDLNDLVRQYRDTLVRRRRGMLELNTAVGQRLLP